MKVVELDIELKWFLNKTSFSVPPPIPKVIRIFELGQRNVSVGKLVMKSWSSFDAWYEIKKKELGESI